jgi:hypothetical protein
VLHWVPQSLWPEAIVLVAIGSGAWFREAGTKSACLKLIREAAPSVRLSEVRSKRAARHAADISWCPDPRQATPRQIAA